MGALPGASDMVSLTSATGSLGDRVSGLRSLLVEPGPTRRLSFSELVGMQRASWVQARLGVLMLKIWL